MTKQCDVTRHSNLLLVSLFRFDLTFSDTISCQKASCCKLELQPTSVLDCRHVFVMLNVSSVMLRESVKYLLIYFTLYVTDQT